MSSVTGLPSLGEATTSELREALRGELILPGEIGRAHV